jgi:hypothetical protein
MPSAGLPLVPFLDQLGVPNIVPAGPDLLRFRASPGSDQAHFGFQLQQLLV